MMREVTVAPSGGGVPRIVLRPHRMLTALLVPADPASDLLVVRVADSAAAVSDRLGGVLLDDSVTWLTTVEVRVSVYLGEGRAGRRDNPRLSVLAARLGRADRGFHARARGDALVCCSAATGDDIDLDPRIVEAARRSGLPVWPAGPLPWAGPLPSAGPLPWAGNRDLGTGGSCER